ncbi:MAG: ATP-binding protein [Acidobacteriota bacterium]
MGQPTPQIEEIAAADIFNEAVLDALPVGIIVLDRHGYVVKYNRFEEQLARRDRSTVIGRHFFEDVASCTNVPQVAGQFREHISSNTLSVELNYAFALPFLPQPRDVYLRMRSFEINSRLFAIIVVEDVSLPRELERQRQRLLDVMVHDLRNPLQGILGYAYLLKRADFDAAQAAKAVATIEQSARRMDALLNGALAEMRGERRAWQPVNMHALALSTLSNLLPAARGRGVALRYRDEAFSDPRFPKRAMKVSGVVDQLASIVQNLISNAIKYAETCVSVDLLERDGQVVLDVHDDGRGIPEDEQVKIFEQGYQAPDSLPGAGIGLYSVRRAAESHGGDVSVRSNGDDGTLFRVTLPAAPQDRLDQRR